MIKKEEVLNPFKGLRDFPPEIEILRRKVFSKIEKIFQIYGFDPIETPIVEKWEVLKGKYGDEAENRLIWRFKLPYSEKEFGLRYDLTVPLARFYARFRPKLPFKRYQIGRVFRYEEPQKGRYREFWQCDFDILGSKSFLADVEILNVVIDVFKKFNFKDYLIKINDRNLLTSIFEKKIGIEKEKIIKVYRIIDKLDKIGIENVIKELEKELNKEQLNEIKRIISISQLRNEEIFVELEKLNLKEIDVYLENLKNIIDFVKDKNRIKIDLCLVRGLDYYTSTIFEAVVEKPKIGSLAGGGRYDNLISKFINQDIPAVGGSIGIERLIDACLELGILKIEEKTYSEVGVIYLENVDLKKVLEIVNKLRENEINTYFHFEGLRNVLEGIKELERRGIEYALIIGEKEISENVFTLQNIRTKERKNLSLEEAINYLKHLKQKV
ncbi:MAG: histidine--tRNA ligase [Candidatus Aenigmatarchaeota archaeon]